jgi:hypothetical protein
MTKLRNFPKLRKLGTLERENRQRIRRRQDKLGCSAVTMQLGGVDSPERTLNSFFSPFGEEKIQLHRSWIFPYRPIVVE